MKTLNYNIIASGSSGNAVRIGNIMIDCGIPFKKMKEELYKVDFLLITHNHSDHLNKITLNHITEEFPNIKIYSTYKVARINKNVVAINTDYLPIWLKECEMYAIEVPHNTITFAYVLLFPDFNVLYATDLKRTDELEEFTEEKHLKYDYVFLEANYDDYKIEGVRTEWHGQYNAYIDSTSRHLSKDQSLKFFVKYKTEGGEHIELHRSKRFY